MENYALWSFSFKYEKPNPRDSARAHTRYKYIQNWAWGKKNNDAN